MKPPTSVLDDAQKRALDALVQRREAVSVCVRRDEQYYLLQSYALAINAARRTLTLSYPDAFAQAAPLELAIGEPLGITFRRGHKKYIFSSLVAGRGTTSDGGPCIHVELPAEMREFQRRAFQRAAVPPDRPLEIRIWIARPAGKSSPRPELLAIARARNLSAGGVQVTVSSGVGQTIRIGDLVALEAAWGDEGMRSIDGVIRHVQRIDDATVGLGIQFIGLELTAAGRETLQLISEQVARFRHPTRARTRAHQRASNSPAAHPRRN